MRRMAGATGSSRQGAESCAAFAPTPLAWASVRDVTRGDLRRIDDSLCRAAVDEERCESLPAVKIVARLYPDLSKPEGFSCDQVHGLELSCSGGRNKTFESRTLRIQSCRHAAKCCTRRFYELANRGLEKVGMTREELHRKLGLPPP
jgi:hypothetical protein